jgi:pyridoxal phosphate enzyme (YggS family)
MPVVADKYKELLFETNGKATLVAVSKTKTNDEISELYNLGQRDFGENYVKELLEKYEALPKDILWHFIGHLQTNKVKLIVPFIHLVHGVDSLKLLTEINKEAKKSGRVVQCLLQIHIASEETKFGFSETELSDFFDDSHYLTELQNIKISGLMGMASFTDDEQKIRNEFRSLKLLYDKYAVSNYSNCCFSILSMGMSADYKIALQEGSNMIRIGSLLFGERTKINKGHSV